MYFLFQAVIQEIFPDFQLTGYFESEETTCISACICYVTFDSYFKVVKHIWETLTMPSESLLIVQVSTLPKEACVEWEFVCIDRAINDNFSVVYNVIDNVEKFLNDSTELQNWSCWPCRAFVKNDLLNDDTLDLESRLIALFGDVPCCVVPVQQIYNGSLAFCSFQAKQCGMHD